jgi:hypothetical protein
VEVPKAVFSKITATFGWSLTSLDICSCARANCEARANGVKVNLRLLLSWSELEPVMIGILARSQTSLAIKVSALAKQPWIADNASDQPVGLGAGNRRIALQIGDDEVELRAAERFDAASLIDHLDRKLCRGDAADADLRHAPGGGIERTDIDGISSVTTERHRAEGPGSQCAARLDEEFAAAVLLGEEGLRRALAIEDGFVALSSHAVSSLFGSVAGL